MECLPREVVNAPFLDAFKARPKGPWSSVGQLHPWQVGWSYIIFKVLSKLSHSLYLGFNVILI